MSPARKTGRPAPRRAAGSAALGERGADRGLRADEEARERARARAGVLRVQVDHRHRANGAPPSSPPPPPRAAAAAAFVAGAAVGREDGDGELRSVVSHRVGQRPVVGGLDRREDAARAAHAAPSVLAARVRVHEARVAVGARRRERAPARRRAAAPRPDRRAASPGATTSAARGCARAAGRGRSSGSSALPTSATRAGRPAAPPARRRRRRSAQVREARELIEAVGLCAHAATHWVPDEQRERRARRRARARRRRRDVRVRGRRRRRARARARARALPARVRAGRAPRSPRRRAGTRRSA